MDFVAFSDSLGVFFVVFVLFLYLFIYLPIVALGPIYRLRSASYYTVKCNAVRYTRGFFQLIRTHCRLFTYRHRHNYTHIDKQQSHTLNHARSLTFHSTHSFNLSLCLCFSFFRCMLSNIELSENECE